MNPATLTRRIFVGSSVAAGLVVTVLGARAAGRRALAPTAPEITAGRDGLSRTSPPWTFWYWVNGNLSSEGITADLEAMRRLGIAGVLITNTVGTPAGPVRVLTPEWRALIQHAVSEGKRLGIEVGINNCDGWNTGGPWVTPANSMQTMVWTETYLEGEQSYCGILPQPPAKLNYYRDIAVVAFAAPAGDVASLGAKPVVTVTSTTPITVTHEYPAPIVARGVTVTVLITQNSPQVPIIWDLQVSQDGREFRTIYHFDRGWRSTQWQIQRTFPVTVSFEATAGRYFRLLAPFVVTLDASRPVNEEATRRDATVEFRILSSRRVSLWEQKAGFENSASHHGALATSLAEGEWITLDETHLPLLGEDEAIRRDTVVELSNRMQPNGVLTWDVPPGDWVVLRIGHSATGFMSGENTEEGRGLDVDKLSPTGLDLHFPRMAGLLLRDNQAFVGKGLNYIFNGSWEAEAQNWTVNFRKEFSERRGYDMTPFLPVMAGGRIVESAEISERFLWDIRRTIADLIAENYWGRFAELCHEHGVELAGKGIGPAQFMGDPLLYQSKNDVPIGEFWLGQELKADCKLTASTAHIHGKKIACAEAFSSMDLAGYPNAGSWIDHPYSLKGPGDRAFCAGINRLIFDAPVQQPAIRATPGMAFVWGQIGAVGANLDRSQTWWELGSAWTLYLARCEWMLQQGQFVADLAVLMNEGPPSVLRRPENLPKGYDYDGISGDALSLVKVRDGHLVLPSGMSYRMLLLPPVQEMTLATLRRVALLARAGAFIVGPKPIASPSLADALAKGTEFRDTVEVVWGYGSKEVWDVSVRDALRAAALEPDFVVNGAEDAEIAFIHRRIDDNEVYFLSNQKKRFESLQCSFRVAGRAAELWYPDSGRAVATAAFASNKERTDLRLEFDPFGSLFVIFRQQHIDPVSTMKRDGVLLPSLLNGFGENMRGFEVAVGGSGVTLTTIQPGHYQVTTTSGRNLAAVVPPLPTFRIGGPWRLNFPSGWGAPAEISVPELISWTAHSVEGIRHFSGTAIYLIEFHLPADALRGHRQVHLDLGEVRELAEVRVNGNVVGIVWKPPYRLDMTASVKSGSNRLEIRVANLWPNRLIGDQSLPPDKQYTKTNWNPFRADTPLLESGLLGPVTVYTLEHLVMH
jgi:hypothetical protein